MSEFEPKPLATPEAPVEETQAVAPVDEVTALKAQIEELNDKFLRTLADTENFKKRVSRERQDERAYAAQETVLAFLPVADNLDRALQAALRQGEQGGLVKGVELTLKQYDDTLRRLGVESVPCEIGKPFDPNLHQALFQEDHAEFEDGSVLEMLQRGYRMGERLVRPAMVKVSRKP